jgi:hypothetical protein
VDQRRKQSSGSSVVACVRSGFAAPKQGKLLLAEEDDTQKLAHRPVRVEPRASRPQLDETAFLPFDGLQGKFVGYMIFHHPFTLSHELRVASPSS